MLLTHAVSGGLCICADMTDMCRPADYKHGTVGRHWNYSFEPMVVAVTKVAPSPGSEPSDSWVHGEPYVKAGDPHSYDTCYFCPPMAGTAKAKMHKDGNEVHNPYQKPQVLYAHLVRRFSTENGVVAEFTAGSGTLAAACASFPDLRGRTGESMHLQSSLVRTSYFFDVSKSHIICFNPFDAVMLIERDPSQLSLIQHRMANLGVMASPGSELQKPRLPKRLPGMMDKHYPFQVRVLVLKRPSFSLSV